MDPETGLYYYRHRTYHSQLGRFVSRDPIGYNYGYNFVEYVLGRPMASGDPTGLGYVCLGITGGGTAVARPPISWLNLMPVGVGLSVSCAAYGCFGHTKANGWNCTTCVQCTLTLMPAAFGVFFSGDAGSARSARWDEKTFVTPDL